MKTYYIGIDDTDNKDSRGTGFQARQLAQLLIDKRLAAVLAVTRHQLYVHPDIPYTSQNSSACIEIRTDNEDQLVKEVRSFLISIAAEGSDVGMAIADLDQIDADIIDWGKRAKNQVLCQNEAKELVRKKSVILEGLTGTRDGIIGALAALGLRKSGNDGRFIWLAEKDLREISGVFAVDELEKLLRGSIINETNHNGLSKQDRIFVGDWLRPLLKNKKRIILAEKAENGFEYEWKASGKDHIKSLSN